jgi:hypothetical protein
MERTTVNEANDAAPENEGDANFDVISFKSVEEIEKINSRISVSRNIPNQQFFATAN